MRASSSLPSQPYEGVLLPVRRRGVLGLYPAPTGVPPDIPGLEAAGVVAAVGPAVTRFEPGDRVMALVAGGGQATRLVVHERCATPVPESIGWAEAGGFPEAFITAHDALFTQSGLSVGERVCIHGGAGGVGTAAIQLAVAAGADVVATVREPGLRADVAALGATALAPEGIVDAGPFDVILELVGGSNLATDIAALATDGRIAVLGLSGGLSAEVDLLALLMTCGRISASSLRARPFERRATATQALARAALSMLSAGSLCVPLAATYPMRAPADAYERFRTGAKFGKIVLINE